MDPAQQAVETALEHDVAAEGEKAPRAQFEELKNSAVESGHRAVACDQSDIGLEQVEQVEGAERERPRCDPHEKEGEPRRAVKDPVKELEQTHRVSDHDGRPFTLDFRFDRRPDFVTFAAADLPPMRRSRADPQRPGRTPAPSAGRWLSQTHAVASSGSRQKRQSSTLPRANASPP
jgi:hypothetical protein